MSVRQDGSTGLMVACQEGRLDVARWLVDEKGCDVNARRTVGSRVCRRADSGMGAHTVRVCARRCVCPIAGSSK
jgi:hypothetical protein